MSKLTEQQLAHIAEAVRSSYSIAGVLRMLRLRVAGANYDTIHNVVRTMQLDTSHWTGQGHRKGCHVAMVPKRPLEAVLVRDMFTGSSKLRARLIAEGVFVAVCMECGLSEWRGQPISLELDHRDGDKTNNELGNLRLLCPNCHAQTPTYRGRNRGKYSVQSPGGGIGDTQQT